MTSDRQDTSEVTTVNSKKGSLRRLMLVSAAVILIGLASYFLAQLTSPQREVALTREQREVDDFLRGYYSAFGNVSVSRLLMLFNDEAILSAPDGSTYRGTDDIRSYY